MCGGEEVIGNSVAFGNFVSRPAIPQKEKQFYIKIYLYKKETPP